MFVYADNAATTAVSKTAMAAMLPALGELYGNPSSLHQKGREANYALMDAREPRPGRSISPAAAPRPTTGPSPRGPGWGRKKGRSISFPIPSNTTPCSTP